MNEHLSASFGVWHDEKKMTKINLLFPLTFHPFATTTLRLAYPHPLIPSLSPPGPPWASTTLM